VQRFLVDANQKDLMRFVLAAYLWRWSQYGIHTPKGTVSGPDIPPTLPTTTNTDLTNPRGDEEESLSPVVLGLLVLGGIFLGAIVISILG
jgi:hypothetical protein